MREAPEPYSSLGEAPPYSGWVRFTGFGYRFNFGPKITPRRAYARGRGWVWMHDLRVGETVMDFTCSDPSAAPCWHLVKEIIYEDVSAVLES